MRRDKSLLLTGHGGPQRETSCPALQDGIKQRIGPRCVDGSIGGERRWIKWLHGDTLSSEVPLPHAYEVKSVCHGSSLTS